MGRVSGGKGLFQGAAIPPRMAGELGAELGSMAGGAGSHQLGPSSTVHGQGKQGRPRAGGWAQLRVQIIKELCDDEADQGQAGKANRKSW